MKQVKHIGVLCGYSFPEGMAPTSRIIAYSKGLVENGVEVDVIIFRPTDRGGTFGPKQGSVGGVRYYYPYKRKWSDSTAGRWLWDRPVSYLLTLWALFRMNRKNRFDFILLSFDSIQNLFLFIIYLRIIGIRPVFIGDEYPIPIRHYLKEKIPAYKTFLYRFIFRYLSAKVLMTENLAKYFNEIHQTPTHILSSITDTSRFEDTAGTPGIERKYLCYMGNMELAKDNVDNIIRAFHLVSSIYPEIDLHLYGIPSLKDRTILESLIAELDLSKRVFIKGRAGYIDVPVIMKKALILLSSQPDTLRAAGGFPTKLGEYLASGVPVLLTDVGEISKYITDGKHAWLVAPMNSIEYAKRIEYILNNYSKAKEIADQGRNYIFEKFSPKTIGLDLKLFFDSLL